MNSAKVVQQVPQGMFHLIVQFVEPGTAEWVMDRSPNLYFSSNDKDRIFIQTCNPVHNMPNHYRLDIDSRGLPRTFNQDEILVIKQPL